MALLDRCWGFYKEEGNFLDLRDAYFKFGRDSVESSLKTLTGNLVSKSWSSSGNILQVSFVGAMVSSFGEYLEELLERYLTAMKAAYIQNHTRTYIAKDDLRKFGTFNDEELLDLGRLMCLEVSLLGTHASTPDDKHNWSVNISEEIDDIRRTPNLRTYIHEHTIKAYDAKLPCSLADRGSALLSITPNWSHSFGDQNGIDSEEWTIQFDFVVDTTLRAICEEDWRAAVEAEKRQIHKAAVVLYGAVVEGLLLDAMERIEESILSDARKTQKIGRELEDASLDELVRLAQHMKRIRKPTGLLGQFIREYRNYVHPGRQRSESFSIGKQEASLARSAVIALARELDAGTLNSDPR